MHALSALAMHGNKHRDKVGNAWTCECSDYIFTFSRAYARNKQCEYLFCKYFCLLNRYYIDNDGVHGETASSRRPIVTNRTSLCTQPTVYSRETLNEHSTTYSRTISNRHPTVHDRTSFSNQSSVSKSPVQRTA